jgi:trans-2-enoyl-CoA reductase
MVPLRRNAAELAVSGGPADAIARSAFPHHAFFSSKKGVPGIGESTGRGLNTRPWATFQYGAVTVGTTHKEKHS